MDNSDNDGGIPATIFDDRFDAVSFLNENLPVLSLGSQNAVKSNRSEQLQATSTEVNSQLSKYNAYNIRTSAELTTLTDEILRGSNRLAYEVEVLRSDVNSLYDLLSETLRDDIQYFVKDDISSEKQATDEDTTQPSHNPEFMQQLRQLGHIKSRLEEVIRVFGEALKFPIPPSDVSMASSLISVSAPELGVANTAEDDKARAAIRQIREEFSDLLNSEGGGVAGYNAARRRLEHFQKLVLVWKGTSEDRARTRVVEGFARIVEDRRKALDAQTNIQPRRQNTDSFRVGGLPVRTGTPGQAASGLFGGLRKLRDEIYLD